ncbi:MAG: hypothetical protein Kow00105_04230 [Phycisphaeraceae bacterium]
MSSQPRFTVFTKPWRDLSLEALGELVHGMGFDGVELPVRPGYQVEPDNAINSLPKARKILLDQRVEIVSVAGETTETMIRACGEAGVRILRIMVRIPHEVDYLTHIEQTRRQWDALLPVLEASGVTLGVQNHKARFLTHAMHLHHALRDYDPKLIGAVWDAAHEAFAGSDPELALDVIWPKLCMVNLKNGLWEKAGEDEFGVVKWKSRWVAGHEGLCDWPRVIGELKRRGYRGDVCLTAEYSEDDLKTVKKLAMSDLALARRCFGER